MKLRFALEPWYNENICDLKMEGLFSLIGKCNALSDIISEKVPDNDELNYLVKQQLNVIKEMLQIASENNAELEDIVQKDNYVEFVLSFATPNDEDSFIKNYSEKCPILSYISVPMSSDVFLSPGRVLFEASACFFYYGSKEKSQKVKKEYSNAWLVIKAAQTSPNNKLVYSHFNEENKTLEMVISFENTNAYKAFINKHEMGDYAFY